MNFKNKTLTVFGCGYVGTQFVKEALAKGMVVTTLTRNPEKIKELTDLGVAKAVQANLHESDWHKEVTEDQDYVLNCVSVADRSLEGYRMSYIGGQRSVIAWAKHVRVGRYIYTGSTGVYPQCHGETVTEKSSTEGASPTGQVLLESEALLKESSFIKHWVILRLAGIYGPGRFYMIEKLKRGEFLFETSGEEVINYIHRDDVCRAIWAVFKGSLAYYNQCYNVSDGHPVMKQELVRKLAEHLNISPSEIKFNAEKKVKMNKKVENKAVMDAFGFECEFNNVLNFENS